MLRFSRAVLAAALTSAVCTGPALAAPICATDTDMAAFRTAAVQQQLMVAALTCKQVEAYNRFVLAYQPELQKSDADLKAYFTRRGNVAEYDTFKTRLANLSSLSDIANGEAYCVNASAAFDMAIRSRQALSSFVADQRLMIAMPRQSMCSQAKLQEAKLQEAKPQEAMLEEAAVQKPPVAAPTRAVLVKALPAPGVKLASVVPSPTPRPSLQTGPQVALERVAMAQTAPKIAPKIVVGHEPAPLVVKLVVVEPTLQQENPPVHAPPRTYAYDDAVRVAADDRPRAAARAEEEDAVDAPRRAGRLQAFQQRRDEEEANEEEGDAYADALLPPRPPRPQVARSGYYAARYAYYQAQFRNGRQPLSLDEDDNFYYRGR